MSKEKEKKTNEASRKDCAKDSLGSQIDHSL